MKIRLLSAVIAALLTIGAAQAAGDPREAVREWNRYLAVAELIRGRDHADYAFGLAGLASATKAGGRDAEAAAARSRAESVWREYRRRIEAARAGRRLCSASDRLDTGPNAPVTPGPRWLRSL